MRSKSELQDGIIEKNYKLFLMMLNCANYNSISMEDVLGISLLEILIEILKNKLVNDFLSF